jgi:acyl carrier protein
VTRAENRDRLVRFLQSISRPDRSVEDLDENESLVQSGLIDSLALLEIVGFLEQEFGVDFSSSGLDPGQLATIPGILDTIERHTA